MYSVGIFVRTFLLFTLLHCVSTISQHGYMTHYFFDHKPVYVNDSMILELTNSFLPDTPGKNYLTCDVNIVTAPSRRILLHFLALEISYADKEIDRLHIYDYKPTGEAERISPAQGLYGLFDAYYNGMAKSVADYTSTGNRLKLDYQGKPTLAYNGFKILITSFRDARGDCGRGYIRCNRKDICIPASTWCDGNHNCGNMDQSDEANCNLGTEDQWEPIDGQITAVVAASVACMAFLITVGIVAYVILKLNKRDHNINHNITVEFKKKKKPPKRQVSSNGELLRLYAPPSYEVVIGMNEDPPPYQSIADEYDTESYDEEDGIFREHVPKDLASGRGINARQNEPSTSGYVEEQTKRTTKPVNKVTSVLVTCDIEGHSAYKTECVHKNSSSDDEEPIKGDYLEHTNYRLCSSPQVNTPTKKQSTTSDADIEVIPYDNSITIIEDLQEDENLAVKNDETIYSEEEDNSDHVNKIHASNGNIPNGKAKHSNSSPKTKANGTTNLMKNGTCSKPNGKIKSNDNNDLSAVSYNRSPSKREAESIDFIDIL